MKILIEHIEKLLPDHDCVVVPGLGGFVQNEVPARFDAESDSFYPGGKEICFNSRLTFNDGFLALAYQESFGISFEESNLQIRQGVQEIKDKIDNGKYVSLGRIGVLWKNEHGQMFFRSENKNFFFPESYGLTSFTFPSIEKRQKKNANSEEHHYRKHKEDEFINIRFHRNSFRNFLTGAAACLFMILLSKPAGNLPESNNQEAFMMHDYLVSSDIAKQKVTEVLSIANTSSVESNDATRSKTPVSKDVHIDKVEKVKHEPVITEAEKTETSPHTYYIVISSFPEKAMAEKWLKGHQTTFKFSGIVEKDGRARVYVRYFPDKDVAQAFLNQFRSTNSEYASAWLLSVKNS